MTTPATDEPPNHSPATGSEPWPDGADDAPAAPIADDESRAAPSTLADSLADQGASKDGAAPSRSETVLSQAREQAEILASRMGELLDSSGRSVSRAASRLHDSVRRGAAEVVAQPPTDVATLLGEVDLPELSSKDALPTLARRLDREADLWRGLLLRAISRAGWADRFTQAVAVLAALACVGLGVSAGVGALLGAVELPGRSLLTLTGVLAVVAGGVLVAWMAAGVRRAQLELAREAGAHTQRIERRLQLVAVALETRSSHPELFGLVLEQLRQGELDNRRPVVETSPESDDPQDLD